MEINLQVLSPFVVWRISRNVYGSLVITVYSSIRNDNVEVNKQISNLNEFSGDRSVSVDDLLIMGCLLALKEMNEFPKKDAVARGWSPGVSAGTVISIYKSMEFVVRFGFKKNSMTVIFDWKYKDRAIFKMCKCSGSTTLFCSRLSTHENWCKRPFSRNWLGCIMNWKLLSLIKVRDKRLKQGMWRTLCKKISPDVLILWMPCQSPWWN